MKSDVENNEDAYGLGDAELHGRQVADIFITKHARLRWAERVNREQASAGYIRNFMWKQLKKGSIELYYTNEQDVYMIEGDLLVVVEFSELEQASDVTESRRYTLVIVTFLGRMSETIELRDLRSYYAWLRHSRRMTLVKHGRKRR